MLNSLGGLGMLKMTNYFWFPKKNSKVLINYSYFGHPSCYSSIRRQGSKQRISLARGCMENLGSIQYEIMHTLGFFHEQSRTDRDTYAAFNWDNIQGSADPETAERRQFKAYS